MRRVVAEKQTPGDPEVRRLIRKIPRAKPPQTVRLVCPGCYWGTQTGDESMHCSFTRCCAKVRRKAWR